MPWRVTGRLAAVSEDGANHTIVEMENGGEIDFILKAGLAVTRLPDGTFRIDETGEIIRTAGLMVVKTERF